MVSYSLKELKEMSTEQMIGVLIMNSCSTTKSSKQLEDRVFKVLAERKIIDYDTMKAEYEKLGMW